MDSSSVIFCKTSWMKYYRGLHSYDPPINGGSYPQETGIAHEAYNFDPYEGVNYGYVTMPAYGKPDITKLGAAKSDQSIDGVTVVWLATSPQNELQVVGWYKDALLNRTLTPRPAHNPNDIQWHFSAKAEDCVCVPFSIRKSIFPKKRFRQIWYPSQHSEDAGAMEFFHTVMNYIDDYEQGLTFENGNVYPDEIVDLGGVSEGAKHQVSVNVYERSSKARRDCLKIHGHTCTVCEMDFEAVYGLRGKEYIHVHHLLPLSEIKDSYQVNPETDLVPVCPNCHAMLHRYKPVLSIEELKAVIGV